MGVGDEPPGRASGATGTPADPGALVSGLAVSLCTWIPACEEQAQHTVERQTRPGLIVDDAVCDRHLEDAERRGYRLREPQDIKGRTGS
jgi:hypothetical protein